MMTQNSMFRRLMMRSTTVRPGRTLTALLALTVAAAVATAMLNLYVDLEAKLTREFSKFGPNVLVTADSGQQMSAYTIESIRSLMGPSDMISPVAYVVAKTAQGKPIVVAGIDMDTARRMNGWWSVSQWPSGEKTALIGERAGDALKSAGEPLSLSFKGRTHVINPAGFLKTGGAEDSRIYLPIAEFTEWTGILPSTVEIVSERTALGGITTISRLQSGIPGIAVRPIRQINEAETRVLGKTKSILLASTLVIGFMVALCVLATLTSSVLERRKDFAVMKALGSSQQMVSGIFLGEALAVAALGALLGFALGSGVAAWIGRVNFNAAVIPRISVFPPVFIGTLLLALLSAAIPLARLHKIEPAVMLKGD